MDSPHVSGKVKRVRGREFKPREPYTHRLRKILEEYPDGSQVLREILQNSDDAKSTEQVFILDHNTYKSNSLFEPDLVNNYHRTSLKLDRYQGPALIAKNNTAFKERDFQSLLKLADSEKRDQFDKIGVMGVGFNSIYHITDSPSFVTDDKYVILDPHERYFNGGVQFDFVQEKLAEEYPDQFAPFGIRCDIPFNGTIFRYPLRTDEDSIDSEISKKIYKPDEILSIFRKFYENESVNCLLFLKYVERISFYELKEGATEPELLYMIQLENSNQVRKERCLIAENIVPMMNSLKSKTLGFNNRLKTSYVASFSQEKKGDPKEISSWLITNYLDDLNDAEAYFKEKFNKNIEDYKFVPNVGLAVPLKNLNVTGRLFCFLPLPISMPFRVSVHGYFAVSTNRRSLWSAADNEDLATDALARIKVAWNKYLFKNVLPKAWVEFLRELRVKATNIKSDDLYKFWPIIKESTGTTTSVISNFCKDLLLDVVNSLSPYDRIFKGPPSSNTIGTIANVPAESYDSSSFKESEFYWLSLSNGYFDDNSFVLHSLTKIVENIGLPLISIPYDILKILKNSKHKKSLRYVTPAFVRAYLGLNRSKWEKTTSREEVLDLFYYILKDKQFNELAGFKMIPLADGTLDIITLSNNSCVYIGPDKDIKDDKNDECNIFKNQLNKFIDKSIRPGLYESLYNNAKAGWNLNIKILDEFVVADMIKVSLNSNVNENGRIRSIIGSIGKKIKNTFSDNEEIQISDHREWIYQLWGNFKHRNWDLTKFENIHLIPTSRSTLRKLNTPKKIFSNQLSNNSSVKELIPIFEKFGVIYIENEFDISEISKWDKIAPYVINPDDVISVLNSFLIDTTYPGNLSHTLQSHEVSALIEYLSTYLRLADKCRIVSKLIDVIKHLPIFTEVDQISSISLLPRNKEWYLLPRSEENSYGKIIYPRDKGGFLDASSQNLCYIFEDIIRIPRLTVIDYWRDYVIPFLELQSPKDIDIVIDKLFDRLQSLLEQDMELKNVLKRISFVPAGTLGMSQQQKLPVSVKLVKPIDLFNPEKEKLADLFFDDERVFPAGKYGIPKASSSEKFFSNVKLLGIKSNLSPHDIVSRINYIVTRKQFSNVQDRSLNLFKYIDENWDAFIKYIQSRKTSGSPNNDNNHPLLKVILEKEWIPAFDASGKLIFSKPRNCYHQKYKDLISFVSPVVEVGIKNMKFRSYLEWNKYPDVGKVLNQLEFCNKSVSNKQPPKNLEQICTAIYKYMAFKEVNSKEEFDYMKRYLKSKPWILCEGKFYRVDKVVFSLPSKFQSEGSLTVQLPNNLRQFENLFKSMGVQDEIGIKDLILIIRNMIKGNNNKVLSINEVNNVIQILKQIAETKKDNPERLDGLLVPSTENILLELHEIHFNDMDDRLNEELRNKHKITHSSVTLDIARELEIPTLSGKIYGNNYTGDNMDWKAYEQNESLTTRIQNIIKDYSIGSLFKEFLQNADDAKATRFFVIIDERKISQRNTLLSEEMKDWQGPAIWIYNDAEFSAKDFQALIKLGVGGKSRDDTKIGRFGIGFNCAFHVTDLPSFVSGRHIVFLDPHARCLPAQGYPPRRSRGTRIDFIDKEFKKCFPDQCYPYDAVGFDFTGEFKGTLFRLPLRTPKSAKKSEITNKVLEIKEIIQLFNSVQGNKEMLFLRNIESCGLYHLKEQSPQLIWNSQINMSDTCRDIRKSITNKMQTFQLEIESDIKIDLQRKKVSEIWLLCTGGHDKVKSEHKDLRSFSTQNLLKARGGVAILLAQSDEKSFSQLKAELYPDPPELKGEMFSYLSLSMASNLSVHLNCNFSLSSARSSILQSDNDFLQAECLDAKWNRYILYEVLPDLHLKLLEEIMKLEDIRYNEDKSNFIPHITNNFWPLGKNSDNLTMEVYKNYGLYVIRKLVLDRYKIFWTKAYGGKFISLPEARILKEDDSIIANILINLQNPVQVVMLNDDKIQQLQKVVAPIESKKFTKIPISGKLICEELHSRAPDNNIILKDVVEEYTHDLLFKLLIFILKDEDSFEVLYGLPLVPLSDGSVGKFGEIYYLGKPKHLDLFPNAERSSKFVSVNLPKDLLNVFSNKRFSTLTNIRKFDARAILDLLSYELQPEKELSWDPNGTSIPNNNWLNKIWSKLNKAEKNYKVKKNLDFTKISKFPLLPVIKPYDVLVQPDVNNPLLYIPENGHTLFSVLVKLKIRFTNKIFPENAHEDLKKCVEETTPVNIIKSLERTRLSLNLTMKQLFEGGNLSSMDYEKFRNFIKNELDTITMKNDKIYSRSKDFMNIMKILKSLPIWPVYSSEDRFIDAESGKLLTIELPFFSFEQNTNFYKYDKSGSDFSALTLLGAAVVNTLEYVTEYIIQPITSSILNSKHLVPSTDYVNFLCEVFSFKRRIIESHFKTSQVIPNKSLTAFVKINTLYDYEAPLFRTVFAETDKFLPTELQNNRICLEAFARMGLNRVLNRDTFISCAQEIEKQVQQNRVPAHIIKDRSKSLIRKLYENIDTLDFNAEQWNKILRISFVPSERNISGQIEYQSPKETSGFEPFEKLCSHKYKNVCWSQSPLFDESIDPIKFDGFSDRYSEVGIPSTENIIEHWFFVVDNFRSFNWKSSDDIKNVIKEIYSTMNERSEKHEVLIRLKINNPDKKLFLNDNYPLDAESWVAGRDLIFGLNDDIREGMYKVKDCLKDYKELLLLAGARELKDYKSDRKIRKHDQKGALIKALLDKLVRQHGSDHHDVVFIVGEEKARIGANRYVLSASSTHFERMFCGGLSESTESKIEVIIEDIRPDVFRVLLRWLYGQTFEDATKSILRKREEFEKTEKKDRECYETYYLSFLVEMLKVTDIYGVGLLKDEIEDMMITSTYITVCNVCEILLWSNECKATQLKEYCKKYIELNKELVMEQRLEFCANASSERERLEESQMLQLILSEEFSDVSAIALDDGFV